MEAPKSTKEREREFIHVSYRTSCSCVVQLRKKNFFRAAKEEERGETALSVLFSWRIFPLPLIGRKMTRLPDSCSTQPPTVVCKMEAQLEYIHNAYTFFCTFGADLYAQSVFINKISALELSWKFIKGALMVG